MLVIFIFILQSKNLSNVDALSIENNPFYGLGNTKIYSVDSLTDDGTINIKLEYGPKTVQNGSPEFFKITLLNKDTNERVLHVDCDVVISKNNIEFFKASNDFSLPFVHTANGVLLTSYNFQDSGDYVISVKIVGINFLPVNTKQVNFTTSISTSEDKHVINIT